MKKAKFVLAGAALVAVLGGAFAFRAKHYDGTLYCTSTASGTTGTLTYAITASNGTLSFCSTVPESTPTSTQIRVFRND